jgi:hypothetical protein
MVLVILLAERSSCAIDVCRVRPVLSGSSHRKRLQHRCATSRIQLSILSAAFWP